MDQRESGRHLRTLFAVGVAGGLTDGELLRRFAASGGEAAEVAFATLVERHGPMVLRVCRSVLGDAHAAEDAFQATFLVLARRAGTVRHRDALGGWLYGVARRVAGCARSSAARRLKHERHAARPLTAAAPEEPAGSDLSPIVREEVGRLPDRFGAAVVLCYLEGLSCEEAAARLGWPVGTVKSRLSRGREKLRSRLLRRGVAPTACLLGAATTADAAPTPLPAARIEATARHAWMFASGHTTGAAALPTAAVQLARRMLMLAGLKTLGWALGAVALLAAGSVGFGALARGGGGPGPSAAPLAIAPRVEPPKKDDRPATAVRPVAVLDEAAKMADEIEEPSGKIFSLASIGGVYARAGQPEAARAVFRRVSELIEGHVDDPYRRATALARLARAQAVAGDREAAHATVTQTLAWASKIEEKGREPERQSLLQIVAMEVAKAGAPVEALRLVDALKDGPAFVRAFDLAEIAGAQAAAGGLSDARATMARADAEAERAEASDKGPGIRVDAARMAQVRGLAALAEAEAKAGEAEAARATLRKAHAIAGRVEPSMRPAPLADIVAARRKTGDRKGADTTLDEALRLAEGLDDPAARVEGLARLAMALADAGDRDAGRVVLNKALDAAPAVPRQFVAVPSVIARAQARLGDWTEARLAALDLGDFYLTEEVALQQSKAGEADAALAWARSLAPGLLRAQALLGVARGLIE